jgi:hypothetical protein
MSLRFAAGSRNRPETRQAPQIRLLSLVITEAQNAIKFFI